MAMLAAPAQPRGGVLGGALTDDWEAEWTRDSVTISSTGVSGPQVEVRESNCTVVITQSGPVVEERELGKGTGYAHGGHTRRFHHRANCREQKCMQCLFEAMDVARATGRDERVGQGSQGLVFKFMGPGKKWYVRKDVAISQQETHAPVVTKLAQASDEHAKYEVAASIVGELNRMFLQGEHIVKLHGMRLYSPDKGAPHHHHQPCGASQHSGHASPALSASSLPSFAAATPQTLEFVMEYVDYTLEHLAKLASLVEQRVLNRIAGRYPPGFPVAPLVTFASSIAAACLVAGLITLAVSTKYGFSWSIPYYKGHFPGTRRRCGCATASDPAEEYPRGLVSRSDYGVLPELVITNIFKQGACGLERLEQWCLVHKDIKGSNILVSRSGVVKIADFGTSKRGKRDRDATTDAHRRDREVTITSPFGMSTRIYQAPELAELPQWGTEGAGALAGCAGGGFPSSIFDSASDLCGLDALGDFGPPAAHDCALGLGGKNGGAAGVLGLDAATVGLGNDDALNLLEALDRPPRARCITSATDVWSLGLTVLVIATPNKEGPWPPQFVEGADNFYHPSCVKDFRVPAMLSPGLRELLGRCLSYDPSRRPSAKQLLSHACLPTRCPCRDDATPQHGGKVTTLAPFIERLLILTNPAEEAVKVEPHLRAFGLSPVDKTGPQEYRQWCDETLHQLDLLHAALKHHQHHHPPGARGAAGGAAAAAATNVGGANGNGNGNGNLPNGNGVAPLDPTLPRVGSSSEFFNGPATPIYGAVSTALSSPGCDSVAPPASFDAAAAAPGRGSLDSTSTHVTAGGGGAASHALARDPHPQPHPHNQSTSTPAAGHPQGGSLHVGHAHVHADSAAAAWLPSAPARAVNHYVSHAPRLSLRHVGYIAPSLDLATGDVEFVGAVCARASLRHAHQDPHDAGHRALREALRHGGAGYAHGVGAHYGYLAGAAGAGSSFSLTGGFMPKALGNGAGGGGGGGDVVADAAVPPGFHGAAPPPGLSFAHAAARGGEEFANRVKALSRLYKQLKTRAKLMMELDYEKSLTTVVHVSSGSEASADRSGEGIAAPGGPAGCGGTGGGGGMLPQMRSAGNMSLASDEEEGDDEDVTRWLAEQEWRSGRGRRGGATKTRQRYDRIVDEQYEKHDRKVRTRGGGGKKNLARGTTQSFHDVLADSFAGQPSHLETVHRGDRDRDRDHRDINAHDRQHRRRPARLMHYHHHLEKP